MCVSMIGVYISVFFFFFKQKTAYEMRISDWSSDVCSSDLTTSEAPRTMSPAANTPSREVIMVRGLAAAGATVYLHGRDLTQMTDAIRALGTDRKSVV